MFAQEIATIIVEAEADRRLLEALKREPLPEPSPLSRALIASMWESRGWR